VIEVNSISFGKSASFTGKKQLVRFELKLLNRDLTARMGLQPSVELIEFFHARLANRNSLNTGTEFLKVDTNAVQGEAAPAVGTFNTGQWWTRLPSGEI